QLGANHAVDRVAATPAHADDFDLRRLQLFTEAHANSRVSSHHILSTSPKFAAPRGQGHEAPANMAFNLDTRVPERLGPARRAFAPDSTSPTTVAYSGCATCSGRSAKPFGSAMRDRKSTRLNSSHRTISYAVFCLKKKTTKKKDK